MAYFYGSKSGAFIDCLHSTGSCGLQPQRSAWWFTMITVIGVVFFFFVAGIEGLVFSSCGQVAPGRENPETKQIYPFWSCQTILVSLLSESKSNVSLFLSLFIIFYYLLSITCVILQREIEGILHTRIGLFCGWCLVPGTAGIPCVNLKALRQPNYAFAAWPSVSQFLTRLIYSCWTVTLHSYVNLTITYYAKDSSFYAVLQKSLKHHW